MIYLELFTSFLLLKKKSALRNSLYVKANTSNISVKIPENVTQNIVRNKTKLAWDILEVNQV